MPWPKTTRYLGKPQPRAEAPLKVSGRAKYTSDVAPKGVLFGAIVRSRWPAALIRSIELDRIRSAPGIRAALLLIDGEQSVHFHGEPLAAVAGISRDAVFDALPLIQIDAAPAPFVVDELDAMAADAPTVIEGQDNLSGARVEQSGDVDAAFAQAAATIEGIYSTQIEIHQPLEPHGAVVVAEGDELTFWNSSQSLFSARDALAAGLGRPQSRIRGICEHMGGGFGGKIEPWRHAEITARLAEAAGAPVKLMLNRWEESVGVGNRPSSFQKIRLAADAQGKLTAFTLDGFGTPGHLAGTPASDGGVIGYPAPFLYPVPNTRVKRAKVAVNAGPATWMRAPGFPVASYGMESALDELALKLGIDPLEMRQRNDPHPIRQREYVIGAERFGWKEKYRAPGSSPGPIKIGVGCAASMWPGAGRGSQAEVQVNPDGTVEVRCGTQDLGTGSRTVVQLIAAEMLGLEPAAITARIGDTRLPPSGTSGGSMTTASVAPAVYDACEKALEELKKISGLEDPTGPHWTKACAALDGQPIVVPGRWREGRSGEWVGGVQFAEVEVDPDTGFVKIRRIVAVHDCGLVVNPLTCESQVYGGVIMGIGLALYEQRVMDRQTGVVLNPNFETYKLPGAADIPEIDVTLLDMPERGVIGIGEPVTVPTAAAIANAVANALGTRVRSLPITPDRVLAALGKLPPLPAQRERDLAMQAAFRRLEAMPVTPPPPQTTTTTTVRRSTRPYA